MEKETILLVNRYSPLLTLTEGIKKYQFYYNKPVELDYGENPNLVTRALKCVELVICNKAMLKQLEVEQGITQKPYKTAKQEAIEEREKAKEKQQVTEKKATAKKARTKKAVNLKLDDTLSSTAKDPASVQ